jgi:predicted metal-dependent enzyme (double-stranded beta helix superfamily)
MPGQTTSVHDHGGAYGAVRVLAGALYERRYIVSDDRARLVSTEHHGPGTVFATTRDTIHELAATAHRPAMTLHVYAPNISSTRAFKGVAHA